MLISYTFPKTVPSTGNSPATQPAAAIKPAAEPAMQIQLRMSHADMFAARLWDWAKTVKRP